MITLGLLGKNIQHSLSQKMYEELLGHEISYHLFDFPSEASIPPLPHFFEQVLGLSITAPYKTHFIPQIALVGGAQELKIVNCLRKSQSKFHSSSPANLYEGTNTDFLAILDVLQQLKSSLGSFHVSLLGDGVTSQVTQKALFQERIPFQVYSRKKNTDFFKINLTKIADSFSALGAHLVINACSRDYRFQGTIDPNCIFWDYNYNFPSHDFLIGKVKTFYDGLSLLKGQAYYALQFWKVPSSIPPSWANQ